MACSSMGMDRAAPMAPRASPHSCRTMMQSVVSSRTCSIVGQHYEGVV